MVEVFFFSGPKVFGSRVWASMWLGRHLEMFRWGSEPKCFGAGDGGDITFLFVLSQSQSPVSSPQKHLWETRTHVFVIFSSTDRLVWCFRIEETRLVCTMSRTLIFGRKTELIGIRGNKSQKVSKWSQNGPKWCPPPFPIPIPIHGVSKILLPGGQTN